MNITLNDNEISIVRDGITIEKNIIDMGIKEYSKELEEYERKYNMTTDEFISKYNNGELGDDEKWFDWLFAYKSFNHLRERERLIKGINI